VLDALAAHQPVGRVHLQQLLHKAQRPLSELADVLLLQGLGARHIRKLEADEARVAHEQVVLLLRERAEHALDAVKLVDLALALPPSPPSE
jgi:hypothetical protein